MKTKMSIAILLLFMCVGCASQNIYLDGMPISNYEYHMKSPHGPRAMFVLVRYFDKQFGDETMLYPEYLDILKPNTIYPDETKHLIVHVRVVNVEGDERIPLMIWYKLKGDIIDEYKILYEGQLPRKDLAIPLPTLLYGKHYYEIVVNGKGEELFRMTGQYTNEGGNARSQMKDTSNH